MKAKKLVMFAMFLGAIALLLSGCGGSAYTLSGRVLDPNGDGLAGVTITSSGKTPMTATTDDKGDWQLVGLKGTNVIKATTMTDLVFDPQMKEVSEASDNLNFKGLYPVLVNKTGKGSVMVYPEKIGYLMGEKVTLTATPDTGWGFSNWSGAYNSADEAITVYMDGAKKVNVFFEQIAGSIIFSDAKLEAAVRRAINKPLGTITKKDVESLNFLNASVNYIQSLKGIENLASLTWLDLSVTGTVQIAELAYLVNLEYLSLASNQIVDTTAIKSLTELNELYLNNNKIVDISSLSWLADKGLKTLDLSNNQVKTLSALTNVKTLEKLMLANNQITDLTPLLGLTNLKELDLSNNTVDKINALNYMKSLEKLNVRKNKLTSIDSIIWLKDGSVRELNLSENQITDVSPLKGLTTLEKINLSSNQIGNITELSKLVNLREANLANNLITDLSPLVTLPLLEKVYLHKNKISDITPLLQMTSLKEITLMDNDLNLSTGLAAWEVVEALRARGVMIRYDYYQNDAPIINYPDYVTKVIKEAEEQTFKVEATDPNRDEMVFSAEGELAAFFDPATQMFSWVPTYDDSALNNGIHSVTFMVQDSETTTKKTVTYTVENVNRAPEIELVGFKEDIVETDRLTFDVVVTDLDGENVTVTVDDGPLKGYFNEATLEFDWQTGYYDEGEYQITFRATDDNPDAPETGVLTVTIRVAKKNQIPVWQIIGDRHVQEDQNLTFTVTAIDDDPEDILTYSAVSDKLAQYFDPATREFNWTPTYSDAGSHPIEFAVTDGIDTVKQSVLIIVEDVDRLPDWAPNQTLKYFVDEYSTLTFTLVATDPDNDLISYGAINLPDGAKINNQTGEFSWTPDRDDITDQNGRTISFTATAKGKYAPNLDVNIVVIDVEFAPELLPIGPKTVYEGQTLTIPLQIIEKDGDVVIASIQFEYEYQYDQNTFTFSFVPNYEICNNTTTKVTKNLTIRITDPQGNFDEEVVPVTIENTNRPPEIMVTYKQGALQDNGTILVHETEKVEFRIDLLDQDGDAPSLLLAGAKLEKFTYDPNSVSSGTFYWETNYNDGAATPYEVKFIATDKKATRELIIPIQVLNVDRPPVISDIKNPFTGIVEPIVVDEYTQITFFVTATDPDGDKIIYSSPDKPAEATINADTGEFRWKPDYNYAGKTRTITFIATANGVPVSRQATITVNDISFKPEFTSPVESGFTVNEGELLQFQVLAIDKDNDPITYAIDFPKDPNTGEYVYSQTVRDMFTNCYDPIEKLFEWRPEYTEATSSSPIKQYNIYFTVTDNIEPAVQRSLLLTVNNKDRAPTITVPQADQNMVVTMVRDMGAQSFNIMITDPDGEAVTLVQEVTGLPTGAQFTVQVPGPGSAVGTVSWSPTLADVGSVELTFTIYSGNLTIQQKVTINVQGTRLTITSLAFDKTTLRPTSDPAQVVSIVATGSVKNSGNVKTLAVPVSWEILRKVTMEDESFFWEIVAKLPPMADLEAIDPGYSRPITYTLSTTLLVGPASLFNLPYGDYWLKATADPQATTGGPADSSIMFTLARPLYKLTVLIDPDQGAYLKSPIQETYEEDSEITVTAIPQEGYMFTNWTDANDQILSTEISYTFAITHDTTIKANFEPITLPRKIAFISKRFRAEGEVFVMGMDGEIYSITSGYNFTDIGTPRWSPVADQLLFDATDATGRRDVYLYDFNNNMGILSKVTANATNTTGSTTINKSPTWLPDGSSFAFISNKSGSFDIWVFSLQGTEIQRISITDDAENMLAWNPVNPSRMVCVTAIGGKSLIVVWTYALENGKWEWKPNQINTETAVAPEGTNPVWSPDGTKIAFEYAGDIFTAEDSNNWYIRKVTNTASIGRTSRNPSWGFAVSPLQLVYESDKLGTFDIFSITSTGSFEGKGDIATRITSTATDETEGRVSPDGSKIMFVSTDVDGDQELFLINANGTGVPMQITNNQGDDYAPRWKP